MKGGDTRSNENQNANPTEISAISSATHLNVFVGIVGLRSGTKSRHRTLQTSFQGSTQATQLVGKHLVTSKRVYFVQDTILVQATGVKLSLNANSCLKRQQSSHPPTSKAAPGMRASSAARKEK